MSFCQKLSRKRILWYQPQLKDYQSPPSHPSLHNISLSLSPTLFQMCQVKPIKESKTQYHSHNMQYTFPRHTVVFSQSLERNCVATNYNYRPDISCYCIGERAARVAWQTQQIIQTKPTLQRTFSPYQQATVESNSPERTSYMNTLFLNEIHG